MNDIMQPEASELSDAAALASGREGSRHMAVTPNVISLPLRASGADSAASRDGEHAALAPGPAGTAPARPVADTARKYPSA